MRSVKGKGRRALSITISAIIRARSSKIVTQVYGSIWNSLGMPDV
jgi:hypothetical protein